MPIIQVKVNCKKNQIGNLSCKTICSNIYKEILAGILHYIYPHQEYLISPPYPPSYITFTSERMVIKTSFMKLFNIYYYSLWGFFCRKFCTFSHLNVLCLSVASCTPVQFSWHWHIKQPHKHLAWRLLNPKSELYKVPELIKKLDWNESKVWSKWRIQENIFVFYMFENGLPNKGFTLTTLFWLDSCIFYMDCFWKILNLYEIKDWNMHSCNNVWDQIFKRGRFEISFGLILPYFHACPKSGLAFTTWYIWSFFMFYDLSWEVIVHFVSETCKPNPE